MSPVMKRLIGAFVLGGIAHPHAGNLGTGAAALTGFASAPFVDPALERGLGSLPFRKLAALKSSKISSKRAAIGGALGQSSAAALSPYKPMTIEPKVNPKYRLGYYPFNKFNTPADAKKGGL